MSYLDEECERIAKKIDQDEMANARLWNILLWTVLIALASFGLSCVFAIVSLGVFLLR